MSIDSGTKINKLLQYKKPGSLYFSSWLKENGYSDQLVHSYRKTGWMSTLSKGVLQRTGEKLSSMAALSSYNEQLKKEFHIAAHSALERYGFNHYVPMGKPLLMVGHPTEDKVPDWLRNDDFEYQMNFFSTKMIPRSFLTTQNFGDFELLVSIPEKAFLECLHLAPRHYALMDLYYIMEQLTTLRSEVVQDLLEKTESIKVKRLFLYMAQKAGHEWYNGLELTKIELGTGKQQLAVNGVYLPEYEITVPKELFDYE